MFREWFVLWDSRPPVGKNENPARSGESADEARRDRQEGTATGLETPVSRSSSVAILLPASGSRNDSVPTATTDYLGTAIRRDFTVTCSQLAQARLRQREKDSATNRASVAECWARIDALLDLHLAARDD